MKIENLDDLMNHFINEACKVEQIHGNAPQRIGLLAASETYRSCAKDVQLLIIKGYKLTK